MKKIVISKLLFYWYLHHILSASFFFHSFIHMASVSFNRIEITRWTEKKQNEHTHTHIRNQIKSVETMIKTSSHCSFSVLIRRSVTPMVCFLRISLKPMTFKHKIVTLFARKWVQHWLNIPCQYLWFWKKKEEAKPQRFRFRFTSCRRT